MAYLNEIQELEENIAYWQKSVEYWNKSKVTWANNDLVNESKLSNKMRLEAIENEWMAELKVNNLKERLVWIKEKEVTYA
jgi:hypothetical protein